MSSNASVFPELPDPPQLSGEEEEALYARAVRAIRESAEGAGEEELTWIDDPAPESPGLRAETGVFVTLFRDEDLRGCLGLTRGSEPLWTAVPRMACASASRDIRFPPVERGELPSLRVEITLLGPLVRLPNDPELLLSRLDPPRCGLYVRARNRSGLLLPQVATRWNWGPKEFLEQVCLKAGLLPEDWKAPSSEIYGFRARMLPPRRVIECSGGALP